MNPRTETLPTTPQTAAAPTIPAAQTSGPPSTDRPRRLLGGVERRHPIRLPCLEVAGVFDRRIPLHVIDVSETGMCVESARPLPFANGALLRFEQANLALPIQVAWSKLVRVDNGPRYRAGVRFLEPTFDQIKTLLGMAVT
jgi:hypothetical protein